MADDLDRLGGAEQHSAGGASRPDDTQRSRDGAATESISASELARFAQVTGLRSRQQVAAAGSVAQAPLAGHAGHAEQEYQGIVIHPTGWGIGGAEITSELGDRNIEGPWRLQTEGPLQLYVDLGEMGSVTPRIFPGSRGGGESDHYRLVQAEQAILKHKNGESPLSDKELAEQRDVVKALGPRVARDARQRLGSMERTLGQVVDSIESQIDENEGRERARTAETARTGGERDPRDPDYQSNWEKVKPDVREGADSSGLERLERDVDLLDQYGDGTVDTSEIRAELARLKLIVKHLNAVGRAAFAADDHIERARESEGEDREDALYEATLEVAKALRAADEAEQEAEESQSKAAKRLARKARRLADRALRRLNRALRRAGKKPRTKKSLTAPLRIMPSAAQRSQPTKLAADLLMTEDIRSVIRKALSDRPPSRRPPPVVRLMAEDFDAELDSTSLDPFRFMEPFPGRPPTPPSALRLLSGTRDPDDPYGLKPWNPLTFTDPQPGKTPPSGGGAGLRAIAPIGTSRGIPDWAAGIQIPEPDELMDPFPGNDEPDNPVRVSVVPEPSETNEEDFAIEGATSDSQDECGGCDCKPPCPPGTVCICEPASGQETHSDDAKPDAQDGGAAAIPFDGYRPPPPPPPSPPGRASRKYRAELEAYVAALAEQNAAAVENVPSADRSRSDAPRARIVSSETAGAAVVVDAQDSPNGGAGEDPERELDSLAGDLSGAARGTAPEVEEVAGQRPAGSGPAGQTGVVPASSERSRPRLTEQATAEGRDQELYRSGWADELERGFRRQSRRGQFPPIYETLDGVTQHVVIRDLGDLSDRQREAFLNAVDSLDDFEQRGTWDGQNTELWVVKDPAAWRKFIESLIKSDVPFGASEPFLNHRQSGKRPLLVIYGPQSDPPVSFEARNPDDDLSGTGTPGGALDTWFGADGEHERWKKRQRLRWIKTLRGTDRANAIAELERERAQAAAELKRLLAIYFPVDNRGYWERVGDRAADLPGEFYDFVVGSPELLAKVLGIVGAGGKRAIDLLAPLLGLEPDFTIEESFIALLEKIGELDFNDLNKFEKWSLRVLVSLLEGFVNAEATVQAAVREVASSPRQFFGTLRNAIDGDVEAQVELTEVAAKLLAVLGGAYARGKLRSRKPGAAAKTELDGESAPPRGSGDGAGGSVAPEGSRPSPSAAGKRWKPGDPIDQPTAAGTAPAPSTIRDRTRKNRRLEGGGEAPNEGAGPGGQQARAAAPTRAQKQPIAQRRVRARRAHLESGTHELKDGSRVDIDSQGRTTRIEADNLTTDQPATRNKNLEPQVGQVGGERFEGGHLLGRQFGGESRIENLVPMTTTANRRFSAIERELASAIKAGKKVVGYRVNVNWGGSIDVPRGFTVRVRIVGKNGEIQRIAKTIENIH